MYQAVNTTRPQFFLQLCVLFAILAINPVSAGAMLDEPILGGRMLVAEDGYVTAEFLGSDAGYFNTLYLVDPAGGDVYLFDKYSSFDQGPINLGWFEAGVELIFRLDVRNTREQFFTGDMQRNADGLAHAMAVTTLNDAGEYITTVGFEDLLGGGDLDFNDFEFRLTNVIDPLRVPAPGVPALLCIGLAGLALRRRR